VRSGVFDAFERYFFQDKVLMTGFSISLSIFDVDYFGQNVGF
jgi:hypothetical protein